MQVIWYLLLNLLPRGLEHLLFATFAIFMFFLTELDERRWTKSGSQKQRAACSLSSPAVPEAVSSHALGRGLLSVSKGAEDMCWCAKATAAQNKACSHRLMFIEYPACSRQRLAPNLIKRRDPPKLFCSGGMSHAALVACDVTTLGIKTHYLPWLEVSTRPARTGKVP